MVDKEYRRKGIAKLLIKHAEKQIKEWNYNKVYLLVDVLNKPAKKLYLSSGYKILFNDYNSTSVIFDEKIKTVPCTNILMSKTIY